MTYIRNMPCELFLDGYLAYRCSQQVQDRMHKDRTLRASLILLYAALEAELNRQHGITSQKDDFSIDKKLKSILATKKVNSIATNELLSEMNIDNPDSFRNVRNGMAHFKSDYNLYDITENNIGRYFAFTKKVFEVIHTPPVIQEWLETAQKKRGQVEPDDVRRGEVSS